MPLDLFYAVLCAVLISKLYGKPLAVIFGLLVVILTLLTKGQP